MVGFGVVLGGRVVAAEGLTGRQIGVFTKSFEHLEFGELAKRISGLGVGGLEAPLRSGGHVEPAEMEERLPLFVEALAKQNLEVLVMTSGINEVDKGGVVERQLRAAVKAGIKRYRLGYFRYDLKKRLESQIADFTAKMKDLAALNAELGIQGQYQNHRGRNFVGAPVWDVVGMLEGIDSKDLGIAFDFAHATVEGANAWELNFMRALPHIVTVYFKDYRLGGGQWGACPLGEGVVSPLSGRLVSELLPEEVPVSLHVEYVGGGGEDRVRATLKAMAEDLQTLRGWMAG